MNWRIKEPLRKALKKERKLKKKKMDLDEILEQVNSKESFLRFVKALKEDKIDEDKKEKINPSSPFSSGVNGWENNTISGFLDSLEAYGKDTDFIENKPNWKNFALLLYAGKFYE